MNWNDLSPEAKIYIELSPVEFAKTSMAASISLLENANSTKEYERIISNCVNLLTLCGKSISYHPNFTLVK